ncbi:hypothetical protein LBW46_20680, partial [Ralstonia solanacearum]
LARLTSNMPYEALLARLKPGGTDNASETLASWLDISDAFCKLASTLDREGVNQVVYSGPKASERLHPDGAAYLLAAGDAAACFARSAMAFVMTQAHFLQKGLIEKLQFTAQPSEPVFQGKLATLRVQSLEVKHSRRGHFEDINWKVCSEDLLFGAEARVELLTRWNPEQERLDKTTRAFVPGVRLSYEVCSQPALEVFAEVLRESSKSGLWTIMDSVQVETSISLTRNKAQKCIDEEWSMADANSVERLVEFCERASKLSEEETCDWPPYLRLTRDLDRIHNDEDLRDAFGIMCMLASTMRGPSGGWHEILSPRQ